MEATFPCAGSHAHPGAAKQTPRDTAPRRHHPAARTVSRRWSRSAWRSSDCRRYGRLRPAAAVRPRRPPRSGNPRPYVGGGNHRHRMQPGAVAARQGRRRRYRPGSPASALEQPRNGAQQFGCACRAKPAAQALPAPATATPSSWLKSDCFTSGLATAVSPAWASEMAAASDSAVAASAAVPRNFFMPATTGVPTRRFTRHRCGTDLPMAYSRPRPTGWPGLSAPAPKDRAPVSRPCTCRTDHPDLR